MYGGQQHCAFSCSCPRTAINRIHTLFSDAEARMTFFHVFVCRDQWDSMLQVLVLQFMHTADISRSVLWLEGDLMGASMWMDRALRGDKSKSTLAYAPRAVASNLWRLSRWNFVFNFRMTLSESWNCEMPCWEIHICTRCSLCSIFCTLSFNCILHQCLVAFLCPISLMFTWIQI